MAKVLLVILIAAFFAPAAFASDIDLIEIEAARREICRKLSPPTTRVFEDETIMSLETISNMDIGFEETVPVLFCGAHDDKLFDDPEYGLSDAVVVNKRGISHNFQEIKDIAERLTQKGWVITKIIIAPDLNLKSKTNKKRTKKSERPQYGALFSYSNSPQLRPDLISATTGTFSLMTDSMISLISLATLSTIPSLTSNINSSCTCKSMKTSS